MDLKALDTKLATNALAAHEDPKGCLPYNPGKGGGYENDQLEAQRFELLTTGWTGERCPTAHVEDGATLRLLDNRSETSPNTLRGR